MSTTPSRAWSLANELSAIEQAVEGSATVLARIQDTQGDLRAMQAWASQAEAVLTLAHRRLHDLGRVLRGELDPWLLAGPHNVVEPGVGRTNPGEDVVFAAKTAARGRNADRHPRR